jgi:hypothetical protein
MFKPGEFWYSPRAAAEWVWLFGTKMRWRSSVIMTPKKGKQKKGHKESHET